MKRYRKTGYRSKMTAAVIAAALWFIFSGFASTDSPVVLKNPDRPLIDLGVYVVDSEPFTTDLPGSGPESDKPAETSETEASEEPAISMEDPSREDPVIVEPVVEIRDKTVTLNGAAIGGMDELVEKLAPEYETAGKVHLIDNYAEYEQYKAVLQKLGEMKLGEIIEEQVD